MKNQTDKITAAEEILKRQKMLAEAEKLARIGSFEWDIPGNKVTWSDGLYHIYGLRPQEFGASFEAFLERVHPSNRDSVRSTIEKAFSEGTSFQMEERIVRPDGENRTLLTRGETIQDENGKTIRLIGVCQDITDAKKAERARIREAKLKAEKSKLEYLLKELRATQTQMIQSEKMASLGSLVAGIMHEMNSPIATLASNADINKRCLKIILEELQSDRISKRVREGKQFQKAVEVLRKNIRSNLGASERLSKIVKSLKSFSRIDEAIFEKVDIHEGLESTLTLLEPHLKNRITIEKKYGNVPKILCYPSELNQVFLNVILNASQAIAGKGTITIRTTSKNGQLNIEIEDTGEGIRPEGIKRLFEPTFSKKGSRIKAGIGLFTALNIVEKHKGEIKVASEVGRGTSFSITLPATRQKS